MGDPRVATLARNLIRYSVALQPGERILIEVFDTGLPLAKALVDEAYEAGGLPFLQLEDQALRGAWLRGATVELLDLEARFSAERMREMHAYIAIRGWRNTAEWAGIPPEQMALYGRHVRQPVHMELRVERTKWCVLRYPNHAMAQASGKSLADFEDFYFDVCCLDYGRMSAAMDTLVTRMQQTDRVEIKGPGTDLTFSIRGIPPVKCAGKRNIPDGEVYTAPVRDSVTGVICFNTPSVHQGFTYEDVTFEFREGRIVKAEANDTAAINQVLDTDEGARYVGEFALGVNPFIHTPMKDTLFDEKIAGSFHFTPGNAYSNADNGNRSAVHWDLITIQRPEYGGGEIRFDGELIRRDGLFVPADLQGLNPDNLV